MGVAPRVVVIGAGIVGTSLADELTARGWTDLTVLDQGPLPVTGGSSSHAPGLVFQANPSRSMAAFARYTVEKLSGLGCFRPVGGLEVATTPERVDELHRRAGFAASAGIPASVLDPDRCLELHPMLDRDRVLAGLHLPSDGLALAVDACRVQAARAVGRGARVLGGQRVVAVEQRAGRVSAVVTETDVFAADLVVLCAGFWGPLLGDLVGTPVPLLPLAHQYVRTGPVGGARDDLPILRHQDARLYFRAHGDAIGIGSYDHRPMPVDPADLTDGVLQFTPADFEVPWQNCGTLLPALRGAQVAEGFNGVFSFTPDGAPLVGESDQVAGLWVAEAVWVTHSAGVARAVAEQLVDGHSSVDLHECDLHRFEEVESAPQSVAVTGARSFVEVYDIVHPLDPRKAPRDLRSSPFRPRQDVLGAVYLDSGGWERPQWYEANAPLLDQLPEVWRAPKRDPWAARWWSPIAAAEAWKTREAVALHDMTSLRRLVVEGPGALDLLRRTSTGKVDKPVGSVTYALLLDGAGGIRSDVTIARTGPESFQLGVNSRADERWLRAHAPDTVQVRDVTGGTCCVGLWGPLARDVLAPLTRDDLSFGYFKAARIRVAGVPVLALRVSYVGELGWELYTGADTGLKLWDLLWEAGAPHGIAAAGRAALQSLRLEKGYRAWGTDMTTEHDPVSAGLGFAARGHVPAVDSGRRLTCLTLDDPGHVVLGREPVLLDGSVAGYVTSAAFGHTIGRTVAYAWLPAGLAPGDPVEVCWFRERLAGTVAAEPLVDPELARIRR